MKKLLFTLLFVLILFVTACSDNGETVNTDKSSNEPTEPTENEIQLGTDKDHPIPVKLGESFVAEEGENEFSESSPAKAEVTISNFKLEKEYFETEEVENDGLSTQKEKTESAINALNQETNELADFIHLDVSLHNLGETSLSEGVLKSSNFSFFDANGKEIDANSFGESTYGASELRPGGSNEGTIILMVPEGEIPTEIIYTAYLNSDIFYYLIELE